MPEKPRAESTGDGYIATTPPDPAQELSPELDERGVEAAATAIAELVYPTWQAASKDARLASPIVPDEAGWAEAAIRAYEASSGTAERLRLAEAVCEAIIAWEHRWTVDAEKPDDLSDAFRAALSAWRAFATAPAGLTGDSETGPGEETEMGEGEMSRSVFTTLSTDTKVNYVFTGKPIERERVFPWWVLEWIMVHWLGDICCRNVPVISARLFWIVQRAYRVKRV
jgi:hypothetical protein